MVGKKHLLLQILNAKAFCKIVEGKGRSERFLTSPPPHLQLESSNESFHLQLTLAQQSRGSKRCAPQHSEFLLLGAGELTPCHALGRVVLNIE